MLAGSKIPRQAHSGWQSFNGMSKKIAIFKNFSKITVNSRPYTRQKCAEKTLSSGKFNETVWSNNGSR